MGLSHDFKTIIIPTSPSALPSSLLKRTVVSTLLSVTKSVMVPVPFGARLRGFQDMVRLAWSHCPAESEARPFEENSQRR